MLVQMGQDGRIRLFRQHHHALVCGELAAAWRGLGREPEDLPFELVLATALHDVAWLRLDRAPCLNLETGLPCSFFEHPLTVRVEAYAHGLDQVAEIHPYAALLSSLHYASFPAVLELDNFQAAERERRSDLALLLGLGPEEQLRIRMHLSYLQLFDNLSIFLCLTPPSANTTAQPSWVEAARHLEVPGGGIFHLTWVDDAVLHADPFPFRDTLELRLPYRELEAGRFTTPQELEEAWELAPDRYWYVSVRSALRLA